VRLDRKQKENVAKILINVGTVTFTGLVIGRFVTAQQGGIGVFLSGLLFSIVCFVIAILVDKE
jgi:hypothetical protein